ncbi:hypothetical protein AA15669_1660 [Saccharibacter floricola DSM 15669]|uniref:Uncharacterized protein n=1 Tax=Saccharibacter floricola DSM 15669 TaxID=1123227 RepID=A0ABQ0P0C4_9PROT|nr:hypothetical protein AA15669_1660 [Saccharibacter floricola DSM 15669]
MCHWDVTQCWRDVVDTSFRLREQRQARWGWGIAHHIARRDYRWDMFSMGKRVFPKERESIIGYDSRFADPSFFYGL